MLKHLIYLVFPFLSLCISAQDIVLDKNVDEQFKEKRGPNMRQYGHIYYGIGIDRKSVV